MRKILAGMMAAAICLSLSLSTFAASGYNTSIINPNQNTTGSTTPSTTPPTTAQVASKADAAIKAALAAGTSASVSLTNVTKMTAESIQTVAAKADAAKTSAVIKLDTVVGGVVTSRVYIDPAKAANLSGEINFAVSTDAKSTANTTKVFDQFFTNKTAVVSLGQKGAYGMEIGIAVKVDLSALNSKNLSFLSYNKATNTFTKITTKYNVDANGYLRFDTPVGGDIVIVDGPLVSK